MISHREVDSLMQAERRLPKSITAAAETHPFSSLGRQSSIYSLTLDEFQHALYDSGKNFGSMNMDEFLTSIWNAEENQQAGTNIASASGNNYSRATAQISNSLGTSSAEPANGQRGISKQPSLSRQGSLTLPAPLCGKTVDEVWSEIHRVQLGNNNGEDNGNNSSSNMHNAINGPRQPTFGEMTLEDFLIKAGVVSEHTTNPPKIAPPQQRHFGVYQSTNKANVGPAFPTRPIPTGATSSYISNGKRTCGDGYLQPLSAQPPEAAAVCYGGSVANGGGGSDGYGIGQTTGMVGPVSPVSSDGFGHDHGQIDNVGSQYGMDMSELRGRKRRIDGPVEKVVERRQRRMIKNRESAARSRARKQAYTVELEAELNQLKEENAQLKRGLAELERKRKQLYSEDMQKMKPQIKAQTAKERLRTMRRSMSCPL